MSNESYEYEITKREAHLGGGWNLTMTHDGKVLGGGAYPLTDDCDDSEAWNQAMERATEWLESRPLDEKKSTPVDLLTIGQEAVVSLALKEKYAALVKNCAEIDSVVSLTADHKEVGKTGYAHQMKDLADACRILGLSSIDGNERQTGLTNEAVNG